MNPQAIEQAAIRVQKAKIAFAKMQAAESLASLEDAWTDFLLAANTVYTKLEEGSKSDGKSKAWFGRMKHERRKDELLNYLHHARNSDEHTIEPVTEKMGGSTRIKGDGRITVSGTIAPGKALHISHLPGRPPKIEVTRPHVRLKAVQSLQKDWFQPPTRHRGRPLTSRDDERVLNVAELGLAYLEWLIVEAKKYAVAS